VNVRSEPGYAGTQMRTILVISVNKDSTRRHIREDAFVAELSKHDVAATPSYALFPNAIPDTAAVMAAARAHGYEGVLSAYALPKQVVVTDVPDAGVLTGVGGGDRYGGARDRIYLPGYVTTDTVVRHQIDLWVPSGTGRLVWAATGESIDPASPAQVDHEISTEIIPALVGLGIIAKSK
jgi:hypothetical protein